MIVGGVVTTRLDLQSEVPQAEEEKSKGARGGDCWFQPYP